MLRSKLLRDCVKAVLLSALIVTPIVWFLPLDRIKNLGWQKKPIVMETNSATSEKQHGKGNSAISFSWNRATRETRITLGVLGLMSVAVWSIIVAKVIQMSIASRHNKKFLKQYRADYPEILTIISKDGPISQLYSAMHSEVHQQREYLASTAEHVRRHALELVSLRLEETYVAEIHRLHASLSVLSSAASGAPFIGLLGTVWGILECFVGLAGSNTATLAAVSPGMAGALIATFAGLVVAIPSLFSYAAFFNWTRRDGKQMLQFKSELLLKLELDWRIPVAHQRDDERTTMERQHVQQPIADLSANGIQFTSK